VEEDVRLSNIEVVVEVEETVVTEVVRTVVEEGRSGTGGRAAGSRSSSYRMS
jgi:hypothetical protein